MPLDLRKDAEDIRAMLNAAVERYAAGSALIATNYAPVSALNLTYDCGLGAHVTLHFDTRTDFEPDGTWTRDTFAQIDRPEWEQAYTTLQDRDLHFILADGSNLTLAAATDDEAYVTVFGQMLVDLLKSVRDTGKLLALPKVPGCEMGVEEVEGMFGWPAYEERGDNNLAASVIA
jgi:hypothetical protein